MALSLRDPHPQRPQRGKLRVLVDTNVLFAAVHSPRFSFEVIQHAIKGDYKLVLSPYILEEARQQIREKMPTKSPILEQILSLSNYNYEPVENPPKEAVEAAFNQGLVRDIKDIPIVLAAIDAKVNYFVTSDKDLTAKDETTKMLRKRLRPILPAQFLRQVMNWTSQELEAIRYRRWEDLQYSDWQYI